MIVYRFSNNTDARSSGRMSFFIHQKVEADHDRSQILNSFTEGNKLHFQHYPLLVFHLEGTKLAAATLDIRMLLDKCVIQELQDTDHSKFC